MSTLREELRKIFDQRGAITPALVVDTARPPDHPLHHRFEWDDAVAGELHRRRQAAELIRSVRVTYKRGADGRDHSTRYWVSVPAPVLGLDPLADRAYQPVDDVVRDPVRYQLLLNECLREWKIFEAKYQGLEEFAEIVGRSSAA